MPLRLATAALCLLSCCSGRSTLTVTKTGTGIGLVTSSDGAVVCGDRCSESVEAGLTITFHAQPNTSSQFGGWSGSGCSGVGDCSLPSDVDATVTAAFTADCGELSADDGTLVLWHLDDQSGQAAVDASDAGRALVLGASSRVESTDPSWVAGELGPSALQFDQASQQYAGFNRSVPEPSAMTIELWLQQTAIAGSGVDGYGDLFVADTSAFVATLGTNGGIQWGVWNAIADNWVVQTVAPGPLADGGWHDLAVSYDGQSFMNVYVDGALLESQEVGALTPSSGGPLYLGGEPANTFFDGTIDEVRYSSVARSAQELASDYAAALACH